MLDIIIVLILILCYTGIDIAPITQRANLSISEYASFHCRATGLNTFWNIQGMNYRSRNITENGYRLSEVIVEVLEGGNIQVHDMYLEILITVENNETSVQCGAFVDTIQFSQPVQLIVQGKYNCYRLARLPLAVHMSSRVKCLCP